MRQIPLDFDPTARTGPIRAARLLSDVMSPPAAFATAGLVMSWLDRPGITGLSWGALYGSLASLLPVLFVVYAYKTGQVSDMHMSDPRERHVPYLIGLLGAGLAWGLVRAYAAAPLLQDLVLTHIAVMLGLTAWNYFKLVSAHVASLAAIALFAGLAVGPGAGWMLAPLVVLILIVRRYLKRHTRGELILGLFTGAAAVIVLAQIGAYAF
ncbi:MAG TPA: hypothetical protein VMN57_01680 [Anaerolineales bacterium]|nr:hypothetical protein [Anaerolineales bacterium]